MQVHLQILISKNPAFVLKTQAGFLKIQMKIYSFTTFFTTTPLSA